MLLILKVYNRQNSGIFIIFTFRYITEHNLQLETFTSIVFKELSQLEESKPGIVAKLLLPILQSSEPTPPPKPNTNVKT